MNAKPVGETGDSGGGAAEDYILIRDEKANAAPGGTFTAGSWQTRDLNQEVADTGGHASLATNQITLAAGTYKVRAHAPAYKVNNHKIKLRNITDLTDIVIGTSEYAGSGDFTQTRSFLEGRFTIGSSKVFELQHRCVSTSSLLGMGFDSTFGVIEVYAVIELWKEA